MQEKQDAKYVSKIIKEAGFRSKAEFARELNFKLNTVNLWGVTNPIPAYLPKLLEYAKKAKKYDELIKDLKA